MSFYAISAYWGHCGIEPHVLRIAERHDLCAPKNCTPPFTRWRADFSFNLHLTKTRPILAISQKSLIFASFTRKRQFLRCHGKTDILQFLTDASLARPPSFPTGQLTVRRLAAGDCGHSLGNALFSSSVRAVFLAMAYFISGCTGADLWHYSYTSFSVAVFSTLPTTYKSLNVFPTLGINCIYPVP